MDARDCLAYVIRPPLEAVAKRHNRPAFASRDACRPMLAIGWQESRLTETRQIDDQGRPMESHGRGLWQFEVIAVKDVIERPSCAWVRTEITAMGYPLDEHLLHEMVAFDARLAAVMARALLWTDPNPLPTTEDTAWLCYTRTWKPGKPHRGTWSEAWRIATEATYPDEDERLVPRVDIAPVSVVDDGALVWGLARGVGAGKRYWMGGYAHNLNVGMLQPTETPLRRLAARLTRAEAEDEIVRENRLRGQGYDAEKLDE